VSPAQLKVDSPGGEAKPWQRAPRIEIDGDHLRWQYVRMAGDEEVVAFGPIKVLALPVETGVKPPLLIDFINLAERSDRTVAAFARKWGLLHPCAHGFPRTHPPLPGEDRRGPFCGTVDADALDGVEPLAVWRLWSKMTGAIVRIASRQSIAGREGMETNGDLSDWQMLVPHDQVKGVMTGTLDAAKRRLSSVVEMWLRIGAVQPRVDPLKPPHLVVSGVDLFGAIALQLAMVVTSTKGLPFCAGCGRAFAPDRRPTSGRNNYCPVCISDKVSARDASTAYRRRLRAGMRRSSAAPA
jgi:hypothetical protein